MSTPEDLFLRLSRLARGVPTNPPGELPPRLATRVLAQVRAEQSEIDISPSERLSLGSLPFAGAAAALCLLVFNAKQEPPRANVELLVQHLIATDFAR